MREAWTDARLDDLSQRMDRGFDRVDADLRGLSSRMDARFDSLEGRFDAFQRTMLQIGAGTIAALIGVIAALIATQV